MSELAHDWAALGVQRPRSVRLSAEARQRLAHLADLRDVASPSQAKQVSAEFSGEEWLAADLLAVRPWLAADTPRREVLGAILDGEWIALLALLGEFGPWVYTPSVRDLQDLSTAYGALVAAAARSSETAVLQAAQKQSAYPSLLARLEGTDYRQPMPEQFDLWALEQAFWQQAQAQAVTQREAWLRKKKP